ncbi:MAG: hypothetical protein HY326_05895 [Chloroflexi bacterium]|nr:hypothetical protein [Chloroflexota bacterium]
MQSARNKCKRRFGRIVLYG